MLIVTPIVIALSKICIAFVISLNVTRRLALVWGDEGVFLVWWGSLRSGIPRVVRWIIMRWESTHPELPWAAKGIGRARWVEDLSQVCEGNGSEEHSDD